MVRMVPVRCSIETFIFDTRKGAFGKPCATGTQNLLAEQAIRSLFVCLRDETVDFRNTFCYHNVYGNRLYKPRLSRQLSLL
jgi:hypothetical protein